MKKKQQTREQVAASEERRPYSAPKIVSRELLESVAADCSTTGKANALDCPQGPISS